jgi:hypothetical protein
MDGPLYLYDSISLPQRVWERKRDDCDGFSVLAAALLNQLNSKYKPVLLTAGLSPLSNSHTVCAFRSSETDLLWFFDNDQLRKVDAPAYLDIVTTIKGNDRLVCWDVRDPVTLKLIEFHIT